MQFPPFEPGWFEQLPGLARVPDQPRFVVEHRTVAAGGASFVHQQIFDEDGLAAWVPQRVKPSADLVLVRTARCDIGDLLGLVPATEVVCNTQIEAEGKTTDVFGVSSVNRPGLEKFTAGTVDVCLQVHDSPFGDFDVALRLNPDGSLQIIETSDADSQVTLRADWAGLAQWIHTETLCGHLINDNRAELDGSLMVITYLEGCVSWPKTPQDQQWGHRFLETMETYRQYRLDPAYLALMDEIEEANSQTGGPPVDG